MNNNSMNNLNNSSMMNTDNSNATQAMPVLNFNGSFHNYGTITGNILNPVYYGDEDDDKAEDSVSSDGNNSSVSSDANDPSVSSSGGNVPDVFRSDEGTLVVQEMIAHGMMDENLQPMGLSQTEMAVVVVELSKRLGISRQWKVFGELWDMKPETLRRSFYKAQEQKKTFGFYDKLRDALR